ncbi:hypothetical protein PGUG_00413 [Meyerozyma guilliermondii ATCC 6260]|uniref:DUF155 domain-containing protein n=1 Tax=Meyerozyma guilliermondii (strain ATCC 6260 / CBS 566 / DSM 6381 / JCM 1539 / NBRC 10279 / NRRL Y-324) TaxID=294746 RepID=A5DAV8_PICGU|nr:uncharacterized protein PGUG_00413 [Meyerozyma guilliermondii ATCC 6260]EDK36315.2 hypothetical protein PGUG_00413 [Meyerozyma guilliermondii ATCC 6260]
MSTNSPYTSGNREIRRPTAKRSPSILVTDSRTNGIKGTRAPFAGHNYKKQLQQQGQPLSSGPLHKRLVNRVNKYTDISVDKLLSNSSDIPSGQSRLPPQLASHPSSPQHRPMSPPVEGYSRNPIRSIPKLSQSLPSRTSKTSQKLVLIPEQQRYTSPPPPMALSSQISPELQTQIQRSRAELMSKEDRQHEFNRMTAYYICEQFNIEAVSKFLAQNHEVKPRLYDESLFVPYSLPLLPGNDGFRVKSNNSAKLERKNQFMEKMINKNEQADHLYEYYSGVETPEDVQNYSMDPETENFDNTPFDPSEPQFFAPPVDETTSDTDSGGSIPAPNKSMSDQPSGTDSRINAQIELSKHHGEMFIFSYGIVVFWNFSEIHEKNILADLAFATDSPDTLLINPIDEQDIETEEFHFEYDSSIHRPRIYNDMITLRSGDHLIKLTMSHAIAQSTKLCLFESRIVHILQSISKLPRKLALTGRLGLKRSQLLKKSGKLFKLRVDVNLSSSILDTPQFFWSSEPALHPLYSGVREYLEIEQRVQVINDRCKVFLEFSDIISDSMNESNTTRITWMILLIILLSLSVSVLEFVLGIV